MFQNLGPDTLVFVSQGTPTDTLPNLRGPFHIKLAVILHAILKVEINQALVWNACLVGHLFEIINDVWPQAKRHLLLQLFGISITTLLHF